MIPQSEYVFQRELKKSRTAAAGTGRQASFRNTDVAGDPAEVRAAQRRIGRAWIQTIRHIERFRPHLQPLIFFYRKSSREAGIDLEIAGALYVIHSHVSVRAGCRIRKSCRI